MVLSCVPKSVTTHAPLCNTNSTNKPKIVKILAVKGLSLVHIQINFESFKVGNKINLFAHFFGKYL